MAAGEGGSWGGGVEVPRIAVGGQGPCGRRESPHLLTDSGTLHTLRSCASAPNPRALRE